MSNDALHRVLKEYANWSLQEFPDERLHQQAQHLLNEVMDLEHAQARGEDISEGLAGVYRLAALIAARMIMLADDRRIDLPEAMDRKHSREKVLAVTLWPAKGGHAFRARKVYKEGKLVALPDECGIVTDDMLNSPAFDPIICGLPRSHEVHRVRHR